MFISSNYSREPEKMIIFSFALNLKYRDVEVLNKTEENFFCG